ncbi:4Fe-4S dicluster domain-containing protein, partial [Campylobacter jejuni]
MTAPTDAPDWLDEHRCTACNLCVSFCPAGVLAMREDLHAVLGQMIEVVHPDSCIGCTVCKTHCPDSPIMVAARDDFKISKLT